MVNVDNNNVEVDFNTYCPLCKYEVVPCHFEPCNSCLDVAFVESTSKPVNFKKKDS